jgi:antitoxin PrlF
MRTWTAKPTKNGNSMALRLEKGMLDASPEFGSGEFSVNVLGPGTLLVHRNTPFEEAGDEDPVLSTFLQFLNQEMKNTPAKITPLSRREHAFMASALKDVELEDDEEFGDDFEIPRLGEDETR